MYYFVGGFNLYKMIAGDNKPELLFALKEARDSLDETIGQLKTLEEIEEPFSVEGGTGLFEYVPAIVKDYEYCLYEIDDTGLNIRADSMKVKQVVVKTPLEINTAKQNIVSEYTKWFNDNIYNDSELSISGTDSTDFSAFADVAQKAEVFFAKFPERNISIESKQGNWFTIDRAAFDDLNAAFDSAIDDKYNTYSDAVTEFSACASVGELDMLWKAYVLGQ